MVAWVIWATVVIIHCTATTEATIQATIPWNNFVQCPFQSTFGLAFVQAPTSDLAGKYPVQFWRAGIPVIASQNPSDSTKVDLSCPGVECPLLGQGYGLFITGRQQCSYCGGCCAVRGPTCPTARWAQNSITRQPVTLPYKPGDACICDECRVCQPGTQQIEDCFAGFYSSTTFASGDVSTTLITSRPTGCSAEGCNGVTSWCRNGISQRCTSYSGQLYSPSTKAFGQVVDIRACSSSYPAIYGWCQDCSNGKIRVSSATPCGNGLVQLEAYVASKLDANALDPFEGSSNPFTVMTDTGTLARMINLGNADCVPLGPGYYKSSPMIFSECPVGVYCPDGVNWYLCPQFTYNPNTQMGDPATACRVCDVSSCDNGEYIVTSMQGQCGNEAWSAHPPPSPSYGSNYRTSANALCLPCPVGMYCIRPTTAILESFRAAALGLPDATDPGLQVRPCSCSNIPGQYMYMDVVAGCNPNTPGQYLPPVCMPCPSGMNCTLGPTNATACPVGTYGGPTGSSECIPCDTDACPGEC